jgi:hypothetical protein
MADHHDNDWLIGPGLALDTSRWFLVATELFLLVDELHVRRLAAVIGSRAFCESRRGDAQAPPRTASGSTVRVLATDEHR